VVLRRGGSLTEYDLEPRFRGEATKPSAAPGDGLSSPSAGATASSLSAHGFVAQVVAAD